MGGAIAFVVILTLAWGAAAAAVWSGHWMSARPGTRTPSGLRVTAGWIAASALLVLAWWQTLGLAVLWVVYAAYSAMIVAALMWVVAGAIGYYLDVQANRQQLHTTGISRQMVLPPMVIVLLGAAAVTAEMVGAGAIAASLQHQTVPQDFPGTVQSAMTITAALSIVFTLVFVTVGATIAGVIIQMKRRNLAERRFAIATAAQERHIAEKTEPLLDRLAEQEDTIARLRNRGGEAEPQF